MQHNPSLKSSNSKNKRQLYQKDDQFSDPQIYDEIYQDIVKIKTNLKLGQVEKIQQIYRLYRKCKDQKKYKKMMEKGKNLNIGTSIATKKGYNWDKRKKDSQEESDDQPGQINQNQIGTMRNTMDQGNYYLQGQGSDELGLRSFAHDHHISIKQLGQLIRQITLTRKKIIDLLDSRKFQTLLKGCFVRYLSDSNYNKNNDNYIIAQIIGIGQGRQQYKIQGLGGAIVNTKMVLKLQETAERVIQLPITMVSNQTKKEGNLQIEKWFQTNREKAPTEKQLKDKLQQHNRLLTQQLSSHEIDKNIQNRAIAMSKGQIEVKTKQDIQNLIDFIVQRIDNCQALQQEQSAKRNDDKIQLIQIRRKKFQYTQIKKNLEQRKKRFLQLHGLQGKGSQKNISIDKNISNNNNLNQNVREKKQSTLKIQEKRLDNIRQKWKLRELLLCTAEGYQKIKLNTLEIHNKYDLELEF